MLFSLCCYNLKSSVPKRKKYCTALYQIRYYPLRYQTKREGKSITEAKALQCSRDMREAGFGFYFHCPFGESTDAKT